MSPPPKQFNIGLAGDFPVDSPTIIPTVPAVLIYMEGRFRAWSLTCSHLGCKLEAKLKQLDCPCHGSRFDLTGQVLRGPASAGLKELRVELTPDGQLILYRS